MAHSHVYSLRAERVYSSISEKCLLLVKHDQIVMQMNHRRTHKGQDKFEISRLNNETPEQRERRRQIQREQRRRKRHQETTSLGSAKTGNRGAEEPPI